METKTVRLGDFATFVNEKCYLNEASRNTYVSTENLKPNRLGVFFPITKLPRTNKVNTFAKGDILIANIRPYFKKIWHANIAGTHSTDVLNIRSNSKQLLQSYLAVVLSDDRFFDYMMATSKGTKMPRGDKKAIMDFKFELPSFKDQIIISDSISIINQKIELNQQINKNLLKLIDNIYLREYFANSQVVLADHVALSDLVPTKTKTFNPKKTSETLVNHFSMPAFDEAHYPMIDKVTSIKSNKNIVEPFSVLVSKMNPQVKRVWLPNISDKILNVASTEFLTFTADSAEMQAFIFAIVNNKSYKQFLMSNTTGSTNSRQRVLPRVAYSFEIAFNRIKAERLGELLVPFLEKIKLTKSEIQRLKKLRALLLPKLLSGNINLSSMEEAMKNA
ncbi:hypothetical protein C1940_16980 (plasmid) [Lactiplantibacillus plantarum subsp. plantarum]|uniref:restriction endonuclease subunit S n=1 Tax=Lactiplantibacillus plantarum TaxID=1590 RepID=UPI000CD374C5|nr:restriction endonuclease subunit S [Lactiplantibacillus plantarum]AUV74147.1 hypothetical protein C1940_16980 [Lactiplantibacillus plantarum subsp. plantarum]